MLMVRQNNKSRSRRPLSLVNILSVAVILWVLLELFVLPRRVVPPPEVTTFETFLKWNPNPRALFLFQRGEQLRLGAEGSFAGLGASGPALYVFDSSGKMIEWSSDTGDDDRFDGGKLHALRLLTIGEARAQIGSGRFSSPIAGQSLSRPE